MPRLSSFPKSCEAAVKPTAGAGKFSVAFMVMAATTMAASGSFKVFLFRIHVVFSCCNISYDIT
jgi:hypothetical protein